jgi:uncharacterized protein
MATCQGEIPSAVSAHSSTTASACAATSTFIATTPTGDASCDSSEEESDGEKGSERKVGDDRPVSISESRPVTPSSDASPDERVTGTLPVSDALIETYYTQADSSREPAAFQLLVQHAEEGNHLAEGYLAVIYNNGTFSVAEKDTSKSNAYAAKALPWLKVAVDERSNGSAQFILGYILEKAVGGEVKNELEAVRCYKLAAEQGNCDAQFRLGVCYGRETGIVTKDLVTAARYFKLAADQGAKKAHYIVGACYGSGIGVTKNWEEAVKYYQLAADQGHAKAQFYLGVCYWNGTGVAKNTEESVRYYKLAANQGHAEAQFNLGLCYQKGTGVAKSMVEAVRYYKLAADQGD